MPGNNMCGGLVEQTTTYPHKSRVVSQESICADSGAAMRSAGYLGETICDSREAASHLSRAVFGRLVVPAWAQDRRRA